MDEKRYWIFVSGSHNIALLYDKNPDQGGELELWLRSESGRPEDARGLHLGMLLQSSGGLKIPPPVSFEGTVEEAFKILRRERAVAEVESTLRFVVFNDSITPEDTRECLEPLGELVALPAVLERIKEIDFVSRLVEAIRQHQGDDGVAKLRGRLQIAAVPGLEELFFPPSS